MRRVQRGARRAMHVTDYRVQRRLAVRLCEVEGLGHAWSGGAPGRAYSDPRGPDASRLVWTFARAAFGTRVR
jgi:poly(3-hydroxybutyrate) depolymerase